jgi:hypothetical protein
MLGRLKMSIDDCISAYTDMFPRIFGKKERLFKIKLSNGKMAYTFSSEKLKDAMCDILTKQNVPIDTKLDDGEVRPCKTSECYLFLTRLLLTLNSFVCAMRAEDKSYARIRDYTVDGNVNHDPLTIADAALATSAAAGFFAPLESGDITYIGAGLGRNNPINEVWGEAVDIWASENAAIQPLTKCVLSVGTGKSKKTPVSNSAYGFVTKTLVDIATETDSTARLAEANIFRAWLNPGTENRYFRYESTPEFVWLVFDDSIDTTW